MTSAPVDRRLVDLADYLIDADAGIIRQISEVPREAGAPDFFHFAGHSADTSAFVRQKNFNITGGASTTRGGATAKAIGEAVERYCSAIFDIHELPLHSYDAAADECVDPELFDWYSEAQYDQPGFIYVPFTHDASVRWTEATDLGTGQTCLVPACTVFLPYTYYQGTGDNPIVQPISTGLSCHCSRPKAAVAAICEAIERDSFTIAWQAALQAPQILAETLSDACYDLLARFEHCGGNVTVLDITTDVGIPTIMTVLRNEHPESAPLVFAAAANPSPEKAVYGCLEELAHTGRYMQQVKTHLARLDPDPNYENVGDQLSHLNFWCDRQNTPLAEFVFGSPERIEFEQIADLSSPTSEGDIRVLVERIEAVGHRVFLADLTTPDIDELGLAVARAVVPGFHGLFMGHRYRSLGCRRRWTVPDRVGRPSAADRANGNPAPHPFP